MDPGQDRDLGRPLKTRVPGKRIRRSLSEKAKIAKRESDRLRAKNRVNLGRAHGVWKQIQDEQGLKTDADVAFFLINIYLQSKSRPQLDPQALDGGSSAQTSEGAGFEYQLSMSSQSEDEPDGPAEPPDQAPPPSTGCKEVSSDQEPEVKVCPGRAKEDDTTTKRQNTGAEKGKMDDEYKASFIVGDGLHFVNLGSSSELVVDEECLLQLFRWCRRCRRQCSVRKRVKGLKLVVSQACCFCSNRCRWTNLPDDDSGFSINGKQTVYGRINPVM